MFFQEVDLLVPVVCLSDTRSSSRLFSFVSFVPQAAVLRRACVSCRGTRPPLIMPTLSSHAAAGAALCCVRRPSPFTSGGVI